MLTIPTHLDLLNRLGRALVDPTRSRILLQLLDGPSYPGTLAAELGLTRPNVSNHLSCLRGCGLVVATPEGRRMRYELAHSALARGLRDLLSATVAVDNDQPCLEPEGVAGIRR